MKSVLPYGVAVLGIALLAAACSGGSNGGQPKDSGDAQGQSGSIVGTYIRDGAPTDSLELKSDGRFSLRERGVPAEGRYEATSGVLTLIMDFGFESAARIQGTTLLDEEGQRWVKQAAKANSLAPSAVLSPVVGQLTVVTSLDDCDNRRWCFNQHGEWTLNKQGQRVGHTPGGGVCKADDTYAWDANLNSPGQDTDEGQPVYAIARGVVAKTFGGCVNADAPSRGSSGQVLIEHTTPNGTQWWSGYLHMSRIQVRPGQQEITESTIVGYISNVGVPNRNNHLHFAVYTGFNTEGGLKSANVTVTERRTAPAAGGTTGPAPIPGPPAFLSKWGGGPRYGQFDLPGGVAVDAQGNVYVTLLGASVFDRIQKFSPTGAFLAQWHTEGGVYDAPEGIAIDAQGNVHVADSAHSRIQKFSPTGVLLATWGTYGDGDGQFQIPQGIATDAQGNVYVSDALSYRIQKFSPTGVFLATLGSSGSHSSFRSERGIAIDTQGNVYVSDPDSHHIQKFSPTGALLATWERQFEPTGNALDPRFGAPGGIATDAQGNVYVADADNHRVQKYSPTGALLARWGSRGTGDGQFEGPRGIATDAQGNVYVADTFNNRIQKFGLKP